jgi:hypothetical protein
MYSYKLATIRVIPSTDIVHNLMLNAILLGAGYLFDVTLRDAHIVKHAIAVT